MEAVNKTETKTIIAKVGKALGLALGVAVVVLGSLDKLDQTTGMQLLGLGLAGLSLGVLNQDEK